MPGKLRATSLSISSWLATVSLLTATACVSAASLEGEPDETRDGGLVTTDDLWSRDNLSFAASQYEHLLSQLGAETRFPRSWDGSRVVVRPAEDWTSGFFPGNLWMLYEFSADERWRVAAESWTERLESQQANTGTHDIGFMMYNSFGQGLRLTGEPRYRDILLASAESLASRFDPDVGCIRSWDWGSWQYPVIIDNMMNLELLFWASRESGDARFRDLAVAHADKTLLHHYRPDGSAFHVVDYDPVTGAVISRGNYQGFADHSSWARGQAWGLYGFVMAHRETGDSRYLDHARRVADFLIAHPRLPEEGVPPWDFDAPEAPPPPRDASAAAIMASALRALGARPDGQAYAETAERILRTLSSSPYRAAHVGEHGGFVLAHAVGHKPAGTEVDVPLVYADYYFLEAHLRSLAPRAP